MSTRLFASPRTFGRKTVPMEMALAPPKPAIGDEFKLFAMTFAGGFLFMTVYLA